MNIKIPLRSPSIDATIEDIQQGADLYIFSDTHDLIVCDMNNEDYMDSTIFSIWINCGKDKSKAIMFDVEINELEEMANAVLKKIELIRKNYSTQIKKQSYAGNLV